MARNGKVLGQLAPAAGTPDEDTVIYTVPEGKSCIISLILAANRSASAETVRITIRPKGQKLANRHYVYYDRAVKANDSVCLGQGFTLEQGDVVGVYSTGGNASFSVFGIEVEL